MVLVDAGKCPVTEKVRNIEKAGGQVALIGDGFYEDVRDVWMEDVDGSGFSLTIPALLIQKEAAEVLKVAATSGLTTKLQANLEISHTSSRSVEVGLWYGTTLDMSGKLLQDLHDYQHLLENNVRFTPHIMTIQCPNCVREIKNRECLSDGLYCLVPPKDSIGQEYNVTDEALLWESLYGRCLHEIVKDKEPDLLTYFNYLYNVRNVCFKTRSFFGYDTLDLLTKDHVIGCAID